MDITDMDFSQSLNDFKEQKDLCRKIAFFGVNQTAVDYLECLAAEVEEGAHQTVCVVNTAGMDDSGFVFWGTEAQKSFDFFTGKVVLSQKKVKRTLYFHPEIINEPNLKKVSWKNVDEVYDFYYSGFSPAGQALQHMEKAGDFLTVGIGAYPDAVYEKDGKKISLGLTESAFDNIDKMRFLVRDALLCGIEEVLIAYPEDCALNGSISFAKKEDGKISMEYGFTDSQTGDDIAVDGGSFLLSETDDFLNDVSFEIPAPQELGKRPFKVYDCSSTEGAKQALLKAKYYFAINEKAVINISKSYVASEKCALYRPSEKMDISACYGEKNSLKLPLPREAFWEDSSKDSSKDALALGIEIKGVFNKNSSEKLQMISDYLEAGADFVFFYPLAHAYPATFYMKDPTNPADVIEEKWFSDKTHLKGCERKRIPLAKIDEKILILERKARALKKNSLSICDQTERVEGEISRLFELFLAGKGKNGDR